MAEIPEEKIRVEVARRMQAGLVNRHRKDCSWRVRRSPGELGEEPEDVVDLLIL